MLQITRKFTGAALLTAILLFGMTVFGMTAWADEEVTGTQETAPQQEAVQASPHVWYQVFHDGAWGQEAQDKSSAAQSSRSATEGLKVWITGVEGGITYRVYLKNGGWQDWVSDGAVAGGENTNNPIEAVQMKLTGYAGQVLEVVYRVSMTGSMPMGWTKSGSPAGVVEKKNTGYVTNVEAYLTELNVFQDKGGYLDTDKPYGFYQDNGVTHYTDAPGAVYTGWVDRDGARYYAKENNLVTGWQYVDGLKFYFDEQSRLVQDLDPVIGIQPSYVLKINKELNVLTAYAKDGDNGYIIPVKAMLCSVGDDTPLGTFRTPEKYRWRLMVNDTYTQYATRITAGQGFLIHSVCYDKPDIYTMQSVGFNGLGIVRSLGCIRLTALNSKWIYDNCPIGTTIEIFEDSSNYGPYFKPKAEQIPADQTWDPTDPLVSQEVRDGAAQKAAETEALRAAEEEAARQAAAEEGGSHNDDGGAVGPGVGL